MLKTSFVPLDREQFALLREAKRIVKEEFGKDLKLQDKKVLEHVYAYALESKGDRLFEIFNELNVDPPPEKQTDDSKKAVKKSNVKTKKDKVEKKVRYYRGQPISEE